MANQRPKPLPNSVEATGMTIITYKGFRILRMDGDNLYFVDLGEFYVDGLESIADAKQCIDRYLKGS